ncbi:MAG: hypothetical protein DRI98_05385 [Bacteroidetes bacterium]|nr:MAG: hypothetical protein DRI98_05385 [Bacteroidota bacterium]
MTQGPYHLISIGLLFILGYFFSLLMLRMQLIQKPDHRKVWNIGLLLFFCSTALLGFLLAVKVNYKLEISWIEDAMLWHVNLGIGFAFIALFHLTWHLNYYLKKRSRHRGSIERENWTPHLIVTPMQHKLLFLLLGYISILSQMVLLREFIKTFHGNELIIGVFLALWMTLTSAGAWAGVRYRKKIGLPSILRVYLSLGSAALVIYMLLILIDRFLFLPGYEPGTMASMIYIILLISIFTLVSGFLFSYLTRAVKTDIPDARNYMLDSLGSLFGGFLFGLILVFAFNNIQIISLLLLTTFLTVILGFRYPSATYRRLGLLLPALLLFLLFSFPGVRKSIEGLRYKKEVVLETRDTPYGNITLTERNGQVIGYMDRNPIMQTGDLSRAEESVHYPALQHPHPSSFLLMGGGLSGTISEVKKYRPRVFDYCDADPWFFKLALPHLPPTGEGQFNFIPMDGRKWLIRAEGVSYDVIISGAPDPYTLGWNRYFTTEFFNLVRLHLAPDGIFCMQLTAGGNYINDKGIRVLNINYRTLKESFAHVVIVPGQISYFLASKKPISLNFPALLEKHPIQTTYVHPDYLDETRLTFDSDMLMDRLSEDAIGINSDMWPRLFFSSLANLEARMGSHSLLASGVIAVIIFLLLMLLLPARSTGIYMMGFTGAGIQILLIFILQSLYGFAYLAAPLMITLFMAGIVLGIRVWKPLVRSASPSNISAMIWFMALIDALGVLLLKYNLLLSNPLLGQMVLGLMNFIPGIIVGSVYGMSVRLSKLDGFINSGRLYSADLAGAALGSFLPVVFLLPLIGVANTFILFFGINVATGLFLLFRWR